MGAAVRWAIGALALIASIDSWIQIIWPALHTYVSKEKPGILRLIADLANPISPIRPEVPMYGYLLLATAFVIFALLFGAMRSFFSYIENSFVPISVLKTNLELTFETDDLSIARLNRTQIYHANRTGVTAYHLNRSVDTPGARIDRSSTYCCSSINHRNISEGAPLLLGNDKKVEIIERFTRPLPINPLTSILPDSLVLALYGLGAFKSVIASREFHTVDHDEYVAAEARLGLTALRYPVSNVNISIVFPAGSEPKEIKFLRITDNTAAELHPHYRKQNGQARYRISVSKFARSSIYVYWKNIDSVVNAVRGPTPPPSPQPPTSTRTRSPGRRSASP